MSHPLERTVASAHCRWDNGLLWILPPDGSFDYEISWIRGGVISHNEEPVSTIRMMLHLYSYLYWGMRSGSCQVFVYIFPLPQFCELWDDIWVIGKPLSRRVQSN